LLDDKPLDSGATFSNPRVSSWNGPRDWKAEIPLSSDSLEVRREDDLIVVSDLRKQVAVARLPLVPAPDVSRQRTRIRDAFATAARKYPGYWDLHERRVKVSWLLLMVFVSQEAFFLAVRRWKGSYYGRLRVLNVVGWIGVGFWLVFFFLADKSPRA
jgi:hypothetical protein